MRKHNTKKPLSLTTETLRTMQDSQLADVGGAGISIISNCNCNLPTHQARNTCRPNGCVE